LSVERGLVTSVEGGGAGQGFNELMHMLKLSGLLGASLPPRRVASLWEAVACVPGVQPTVKKANQRSEIT
jgi:hypothetical protein